MKKILFLILIITILFLSSCSVNNEKINETTSDTTNNDLIGNFEDGTDELTQKYDEEKKTFLKKAGVSSFYEDDYSFKEPYTTVLLEKYKNKKLAFEFCSINDIFYIGNEKYISLDLGGNTAILKLNDDLYNYILSVDSELPSLPFVSFILEDIASNQSNITGNIEFDISIIGEDTESDYNENIYLNKNHRTLKGTLTDIYFYSFE